MYSNPTTQLPSASRNIGPKNTTQTEGSYSTWFLVSLVYWALEPECEILMFVWSFGLPRKCSEFSGLLCCNRSPVCFDADWTLDRDGDGDVDMDAARINTLLATPNSSRGYRISKRTAPSNLRSKKGNSAGKDSWSHVPASSGLQV